MIRPLWTAAELAAATGGTASPPFDAHGVTFDSREVLGGELFVALHGSMADGHDFVPRALARGAAGVLVDRPVEGPQLRVADTMAALEALGAAARARVDATVIGVTGSVGKTGVKEALRLAFTRMAPEATHASVKSYNNHTGVPLSLARMPADTRYGVFEMGMNHGGEIEALTRQVRPHIALITWVAPVHIENFASEEAIADAKAEIFAGLEPGGTAILPADNRHFARLLAAARRPACRILSFGEAEGADVRLVAFAPDEGGSRLVADVAGERLDCRIGMAGRHWANNALGVLAAIHAAGGDLGEAGLALAGLRDLSGRGARIPLVLPAGPALLVDESYNANPASMAAALEVLGSLPGRRLAVLGAMKELGAHGPAAHAGLADPIRAAGVAELALVGPEMAALQLPDAVHLPDWQGALDWVRATLRPGDVLMVKGSNSVGLGGLVAALSDELAARPDHAQADGGRAA